MKISILLPHFKKYGGVRRYLEFGKRLIDKDCEVVIHAQNPLVTDFVREINFPQKSIQPLINLKDYDADVCICGDAGLSKNIYLSKAPLKIINIIFPYWSNYIIGQYGKVIYDPKIVVVGNGSGWEAQNPEHLKDVEIPLNWHTIPGAINLDMFRKVNTAREFNKFKVLFQGRNRPWKNLNIIIDACNKLSKDYKDIKFGYIATEPLINLNNDVASHINIPQEDMKNIYSSYNCYISCETLAGWQNCAAEAMACELPVICTDIGTQDFAFHHKTALVMKRPDLSSDLLIKRILLYKNNDKIRLAFGKMGRTEVSKLNWDNYTDRWIDFMNNQLEKIQSNSIDNEAVIKSIVSFNSIIKNKLETDNVKAVEIEASINKQRNQIQIPVPKPEPVASTTSIPVQSKVNSIEVKTSASPSDDKINEAIKNNKSYIAGEIVKNEVVKPSEVKTELTKEETISILNEIVNKNKADNAVKTGTLTKEQGQAFIKNEIGDIKASVANLALSLRTYLAENNIAVGSSNLSEVKTSKTFDKYERLGPYHWNSKDAIYNNYVDSLINIFEKLREIHDFKNIADIGGGDGAIAFKLARKGFNVNIIETNKFAVTLAEKMITEVVKSLPLPPDTKIEMTIQSFFDLPNNHNLDCLLLSQVIEHFTNPENAVLKIKDMNPKIAVLTTPLAKPDGNLWDSAYHNKEFTENEFKDLFKPLLNDYAISYGNDGTYNQFIILQNKKFMLEIYFNSLSFVVSENDSTKNEMINSIKTITDLNINNMQIL